MKIRSIKFECLIVTLMFVMLFFFATAALWAVSVRYNIFLNLSGVDVFLWDGAAYIEIDNIKFEFFKFEHGTFMPTYDHSVFTLPLPGLDDKGSNLIVPFWLIMLLLALPWYFLHRKHRKLQRLAWIRAGRCDHCGYSLEGNQTGRCPECGKISLDEAVDVTT